MVDGRPLGSGEAPTAAAELVIVLLPMQDEQLAMGVQGHASIIVTWPRLGIPSPPRETTAAEPDFATCYQAEMPALISFLIECGANPPDTREKPPTGRL